MDFLKNMFVYINLWKKRLFKPFGDNWYFQVVFHQYILHGNYHLLSTPLWMAGRENQRMAGDETPIHSAIKDN